jgi:protein-disulfide isomerase
MSFIKLQLVFSLLIFLAFGCRGRAETEKIAELNGTAITRAELDKSAGKALAKARQELYELEKQALNDYIGATLLSKEAQAQNISVATLLEREVNSKVPPVSEDEIRRFYEANKARIGVELEKVHDQIREYVHEQRTTARKLEYFKTLREQAKITTYLKPPAIHRVHVVTTGAPSKGADNAPVTIVKFEDFECPFCRNVQPTLREVLARYDGKVRIVHKDLPLQAIHPQAQIAAEAARCAGEQGKYWEYHDTLYAKAPKLAAVDLKSYAKEKALDSAKFDQCLDSGKHKASVQKDLAEGAQLGITGTPTFFINGRETSGALPMESFAAIIDDELGGAK